MKILVWKAALFLELVVSGTAVADPAEPADGKPSAVPLPPEVKAPAIPERSKMDAAGGLVDQVASTPPAGSPERNAIMDVLRFDFYKDKEAARKNEKKVLFVVKHLKVKDGWACVNGLPTRDGKEVAEPRWAVLRKTKDGWVDVDYFGKLGPFATEAEAMDALDMKKEMVKRLLPKLPGCPAEIFP